MDGLQILKDEYLFDGKLRELSPVTIATRDYRVGRFLSWLRGQDIREPDQLDQKIINSYVYYVIQTFPSPFTSKVWMGTIMAFLNWAAGREDPIPQFKIKTIKTPRIIRDVLDRKDIDLLEKAAKIERDKLVVRILADTGIRVAELINLTSSDLKLISGRYFLRVRGKGAKDRDIEILPSLAKRIHNIKSERLFMSSRFDKPLDIHGAQQMISRLGVRVLNRKVHPHLFRHSFVTWMLLPEEEGGGGMDPVLLAKIVGHADLTMIMNVYNHIKSREAGARLIKALSKR